MIRAARPEDANAVVPLILQAMGTLAQKFANSKAPEVIRDLFTHFFQIRNNQYSFENTLVYEDENNVLGSVNAYDGALLVPLRENFFNYLKEHLSIHDFNFEPETERGEFYLDTISVYPEAQGKGIGKQLIEAGINWGATLGHTKIGLLVETENVNAKRLYQKMGFQMAGIKKFMGGNYAHMIYPLT